MHYCNSSYLCVIVFGFIIGFFPLMALALTLNHDLGLESIRPWPCVLGLDVGLGLDSAGILTSLSVNQPDDHIEVTVC